MKLVMAGFLGPRRDGGEGARDNRRRQAEMEACVVRAKSKCHMTLLAVRLGSTMMTTANEILDSGDQIVEAGCPSVLAPLRFLGRAQKIRGQAGLTAFSAP
jgi:hypothetical protein